MLTALKSLFRRRPPHVWDLARLEHTLADLRATYGPLERKPYPWLAGVKPAPKRTGRAHLRLVVNR